jgi:hypothetical protein
MKTLKRERIPSEFREERELKRQMREHHKPFFAFSAGDTLPPAEYEASDLFRR